MKSVLISMLVLPHLAMLAASGTLAAEQVPNLNINSSCQAEAAVAPEGKRQCLKAEQDAREELARQWEKFAVADRRQCTQLATLGGTASYVELLTCLQMQVEARKLPSDAKQ